MIRYDSVYLTCSKKLTCSQVSPPNGTNRKKILEKNELKQIEKHVKSGTVPLSQGNTGSKKN